MIAGIDVGKRKSYMAVIEGEEVTYIGEPRFDIPLKFVGIDAPLTMPKSGFFRECERKLQKIGIVVIPPIFLRDIHEIGVRFMERFRSMGVEVFEVYPYATRYILGMRYSKKKREGRLKILEGLSKYLKFPYTEDHNEIDAIISALTVKFYLNGKGENICGEDGCITVPMMQR